MLCFLILIEIWVLSARLQEFSLFSQLTKALSGMTCWKTPGSIMSLALHVSQSMALKWHVLWNVRVLQTLRLSLALRKWAHLMLLVGFRHQRVLILPEDDEATGPPNTTLMCNKLFSGTLQNKKTEIWVKLKCISFKGYSLLILLC